MTNLINTPAQDLDTASLDAVVGGGVMIPDIRKQEQSDKLITVRKAGEHPQD